MTHEKPTIADATWKTQEVFKLDSMKMSQKVRETIENAIAFAIFAERQNQWYTLYLGGEKPE